LHKYTQPFGFSKLFFFKIFGNSAEAFLKVTNILVLAGVYRSGEMVNIFADLADGMTLYILLVKKCHQII
tara:strand:+ start:52781 stop:52990 length:210 start_codon:yes stop_codon:yes gene_type:complete